MRALRWDGRNLRVAAVDPPRPGPGEALVRVHLAGICRTDIEIVRGYLGFRGTLGHEFVGTVTEAPDPRLVGRRVVGEINLACGSCHTCTGGLPRHCPNRRVLGIAGADGAFAELLRLPVTNLHEVPDGVGDREAVFTEPLAAAFEITSQVSVPAGARAMVLGDGKLGLLTAQVLSLVGARVTVVGRHARKLALARALGLDTTLVAGPAAEAGSADLVVEASGRPEGLARALSVVRPRGTVVLKTTLAGEHRLDLAGLVINEVTIVGSRCGDFPPALRALAEHRVRVAPLIDATFPLSEGAAALARAATPGVLKVLLDPRG